MAKMKSDVVCLKDLVKRLDGSPMPAGDVV